MSENKDETRTTGATIYVQDCMKETSAHGGALSKPASSTADVIIAGVDGAQESKPRIQTMSDDNDNSMISEEHLGTNASPSTTLREIDEDSEDSGVLTTGYTAHKGKCMLKIAGVQQSSPTIRILGKLRVGIGTAWELHRVRDAKNKKAPTSKVPNGKPAAAPSGKPTVVPNSKPTAELNSKSMLIPGDSQSAMSEANEGGVHGLHAIAPVPTIGQAAELNTSNNNRTVLSTKLSDKRARNDTGNVLP